mgnify:FL=1|tara:strand:+ start:466 stop:654 length:189 start_codon:yes stop_codon:yes gene_type:complete
MICVICKGEIEKHYTEEGVMYWDQGHNAEPIADGRCCDKCNQDIVVQYRISDMLVNKGGNNG